MTGYIFIGQNLLHYASGVTHIGAWTVRMDSARRSVSRHELAGRWFAVKGASTFLMIL